MPSGNGTVSIHHVILLLIARFCLLAKRSYKSGEAIQALQFDYKPIFDLCQYRHAIVTRFNDADKFTIMVHSSNDTEVTHENGIQTTV